MCVRRSVYRPKGILVIGIFGAEFGARFEIELFGSQAHNDPCLGCGIMRNLSKPMSQRNRQCQISEGREQVAVGANGIFVESLYVAPRVSGLSSRGIFAFGGVEA